MNKTILSLIQAKAELLIDQLEKNKRTISTVELLTRGELAQLISQSNQCLCSYVISQPCYRILEIASDLTGYDHSYIAAKACLAKAKTDIVLAVSGTYALVYICIISNDILNRYSAKLYYQNDEKQLRLQVCSIVLNLLIYATN
jgi:nicotinamide mononucleotide (NMN) deamidase PncC